MLSALTLTSALAAGLMLPLVHAAAFQTQASEWTTAGWYVVEYSGRGSAGAIRAGPFRDPPACESVRERQFPMALRGHPELGSFECRQLRSPPSQDFGPS